MALNAKVRLVSIQKVTGKNRGVFVFQFSPKLLNLGKLDLSRYFKFESEGNYTVDKWTFSDGLASVYVDYH
jgi:hypothetical protein